MAGEIPTAAALADVTAAGTHAYVVMRRGAAARAAATPFPVVFENEAATVLELRR